MVCSIYQGLLISLATASSKKKIAVIRRAMRVHLIQCKFCKKNHIKLGEK